VSTVLSTSTLSKFKNKECGSVMINQYRQECTLCEGAFGIVKLMMDIKTKQQYAVKIMNKKLLDKKSAGKDKYGNSKTCYDCILEEL
jgi:serine/threonine protein kinase